MDTGNPKGPCCNHQLDITQNFPERDYHVAWPRTQWSVDVFGEIFLIVNRCRRARFTAGGTIPYPGSPEFYKKAR